MKKYAVAILSFFDNQNKLFVVDAKTDTQAMIKTILAFKEESGEDMNDADTLEWIEDMKEMTIEDIQQCLFDSDMSISKPTQIKYN